MKELKIVFQDEDQYIILYINPPLNGSSRSYTKTSTCYAQSAFRVLQGLFNLYMRVKSTILLYLGSSCVHTPEMIHLSLLRTHFSGTSYKPMIVTSL
jgi:hypothetical protein